MYQINLTPHAKTFYLEWLLDQSSHRYNIAIDQTLDGRLNIDRLRKALKKYITENLLLNSHIQNINDELYWVKNDNIAELQFSNHSPNKTELINYVSTSFDLHQGPLYRFKIYQTSPKTYRFVLVFHHILIDGSCLDAGVFDEISNYYNNPIYLGKYNIEAQQQKLQNLADTLIQELEHNKTKHKDFWKNQLSEIENIDLSFLKSTKKNSKNLSIESDKKIEELKFNYEKKTLISLKKICETYEITPYIYGQCIFALLINKHTNQQRFSISYPIKIKEGKDFIFGAQVNTNLINFEITNTTTIKDLFDKTREFLTSTTRNPPRYGYFPIGDILKDNDKNLLNISFIQTNLRETAFNFTGIKKVHISSELNIDSVTKDMLLMEQELKNHTLNYRVRYYKNSINKKLLTGFLKRYTKIFHDILEDLISNNHYKKLSEYRLLKARQYQELIYRLNKHYKPYPSEDTVHKLFTQQAYKHPHNIALVYNNTRLTYHQLNKKSEQLSDYLRQNHDIQANDLIAIFLDRSEYIIIAILAILKSGGAYVPISPSLPKERIDYILNDTRTKIIITSEQYQEKIKTENRHVLAIDTDEIQKKLTANYSSNTPIKIAPNSLAYVIYTSGTTGNPKGVLQQHNNVIRLFSATQAWFNFSEKDVWTLFHSHIFDFSVWEIFGALLYGGKLVIPTDTQVKDTNLFYELCYKEKITILNQTPTAFYPFLDVAIDNFRNKKLDTLRYIIFGGEALNPYNLKNWFNHYGCNHPKLINMFGTTETTVHVTYKEIAEEDTDKKMSIGVPIPDQKLFVLDNTLIPAPIGVIGELYVGGAGLARGYLNQPQLTNERFIKNIFQTHEEKLKNINARLYKTGDLVRTQLDGSLEYIGRNDSQVKIRGYRIELSEIENILISYPGIKQATVLAKKNITDNISYGNNKFLVAYYTASTKLNEEKILDYLSEKLPEYMLPSLLIYVEKFTSTINGKINIKTLPDPKFAQISKYKGPSNEKESLICEAFTQILGIKKIGINADFFKLGGDSIQAIRLAAALQTKFNIKVTDIFNLRTPKKLAIHLNFSENLLKDKLAHIKTVYNNMQKPSLSKEKPFSTYATNINNLRLDLTLKKPITNILLTGATGYLGCNILNQLLNLTNYNVYILVRANTQEDAYERINKKFQFYFDKSLNNFFGSRIVVLKADIEKIQLGLSEEQYQLLAQNIDSIIHAAALVKHYGHYDEFYSSNVQATIHLLNLSKLTNLKDFHYISTCSVFYFSSNNNTDKLIYNEEYSHNSQDELNNSYNQTKLEGEHYAIKCRNEGINTNIYRVGNLAFNSENFRAQENIEDNAFYNWLKTLLTMNCISPDIGKIQISQVDLTAKAIVKLFDKSQLINNTFHIFNPHLFDITLALSENKRHPLNILPINKFIDNIFDLLSNNLYQDLIMKFLLRQGWIDGWGMIYREILQDKTQHILTQLGFEWPPVSNFEFNKYLESTNNLDITSEKK